MLVVTELVVNDLFVCVLVQQFTFSDITIMKISEMCRIWEWCHGFGGFIVIFVERFVERSFFYL